jgi:hypothetical protein
MNKIRIFPSWEQIKAFKTPLTEGELVLTEFLDTHLPSDWKIYIQPYFNGNRPDIVILNPRVGLMIFEIKDWKEGCYFCKREEIFDKNKNKKKLVRKFFVSDERGCWPIANPITQVERYRNNLICIYIPEIGEQIDRNIKNLSAFKMGLYFHNMSTDKAKKLVSAPTKRCIVFGNDIIRPEKLSDIIPDLNRKYSLSMKKDWAEKIRFWLKPPFHSIEQGTQLELSEAQKRHVEPAPGSHQRLRGVVGSGKSLVLAQRAANLASEGKKVLIVSFNITLWHYLKDFVSRARVNFNWDRIEFNYFHGFCRDFLSENDVPWPTTEVVIDKGEFLNKIIPKLVLKTIKSGLNKKKRRYDAIMIDEGQDFQESWYHTLCAFLSENDEVFFVVDERQNVYERSLQWIVSMHGTKFRGRWRELKESYRLPPLVIDEANRFAHFFLHDVGVNAIPSNYQLELFEPHLIWRDVDSEEHTKEKVLSAITWLTEKKNIHPSDIVVLVPTHSMGWELVQMLKNYNINVNHVFEDESKDHHHKKSFWMGDSRLKASTIHSFKGWELKNVIIIVPTIKNAKQYRQSDYLFYIAITRVRENLIVLNSSPRYKEYGKSWPQTW